MLLIELNASVESNRANPVDDATDQIKSGQINK